MTLEEDRKTESKKHEAMLTPIQRIALEKAFPTSERLKPLGRTLSNLFLFGRNTPSDYPLAFWKNVIEDLDMEFCADALEDDRRLGLGYEGMAREQYLGATKPPPPEQKGMPMIPFGVPPSQPAIAPKRRGLFRRKG
jgi:hypothetical protein